MANYIKSKSKTGKKPRTGNVYHGEYTRLPETDERIFVLIGYKTVKGKYTRDVVAFNSVAAAKRAGWTVVNW